MVKEMSVKTSLANKSRNNRLFIDNLCRQIAVEITLPFAKRDTTWFDVLTPSYCSRIHGKPEFVTASKTGCVFRPATAVLSQTEINAISEFIAHHATVRQLPRSVERDARPIQRLPTHRTQHYDRNNTAFSIIDNG